jgi:enoyl-CoA hydratase/carnithine racemase
MTGKALYLEKQGPIGWLVLNRPDKRNAFTQAMWEEIPVLVAEAEADPEIKIIILRSSTPEAFSAGADISEFAAINKDPGRSNANREALRRAQRDVARATKPTIAMIEGVCVGGGCGLALACDMRFAEPSARFGITPVKLGLVYSLQDTKQLVDLVGPAQAKSILFTGRLVSAEEALRIGMINDIFAGGTLEAEVINFAESIAANSQFGVRGIKKIIQLILDGESDDTAETREMFLESFGGADYLEGVDAFLNKRKPKFPFS